MTILCCDYQALATEHCTAGEDALVLLSPHLQTSGTQLSHKLGCYSVIVGIEPSRGEEIQQNIGRPGLTEPSNPVTVYHQGLFNQPNFVEPSKMVYSLS